MGVNGSALGVGAAFYPLLGGALATVRWSAPFAFFGVGILVGLAALVALEEPPVDERLGVRDYLGRMRTAVLVPRALGLYLAVFSAFFLFYGAVLTALPLLLSDEFGLGADRIGVLLSAVAVASALVSSQYGRIATRFDAAELVALGFVCFGVGLVGVRFAGSPPLVGLALLGFGAGFGVTMPSLDTAVVTLVSEQLRAGMMGVRTSMLRLGQTAGPVAFTLTAEAAFRTRLGGYRTLLLVAGGVAATAGVAAFASVRRYGEGQ